MINERIRAGADAIKLLEASIGDKAYKNALASPRPEESLRAVVLASLEQNGVKRTTDDVWRAVAWHTMNNPESVPTEQTFMLLDVLRDPDICGAPYDAEILKWVQDEFISSSFRRPALLDYAGKTWKDAFTPEISQKLWADALRSFDGESTQRLLQQVPAGSIPYLETIAGKSGDGGSHPAIEVFAKSLTDAELIDRIKLLHKCLDGDSSGKHVEVLERVALTHLMLLTFEHCGRHGIDRQLVNGFFARMDKHMEGYTHKMYAPHAGKLAQLALAVGASSSSALAGIVMADGHAKLTSSELSALIKGGMRVHNGDSYRKEYLLNLVDGPDRRAVADAMSEEQRRDYMFHGIGAGVTAAAVKNWGNNNPESCTSEDLLDVLHAAGFGLGRQIRFNDSDPAKWVYEWMGCKDEAKRYAFVKMHVLGLLPADLQYGGHGPLNYAAYYGDVKAIEALAKAGYDIEAKSSLHYATSMEEKKQNEYGCTPLLIAAKYEREGCVKCLIQLGADVGVKSGSGAGLAQMTKSDEIKRMVRSVKIGRTVEGAMTEQAASKGSSKKRPDVGVL